MYGAGALRPGALAMCQQGFVLQGLIALWLGFGPACQHAKGLLLQLRLCRSWSFHPILASSVVTQVVKALIDLRDASRCVRCHAQQVITLW